MTEETSSSASEWPVYESADAIARLELENIIPVELRARRRDGGFDDLPGPDLDATEEEIAALRQVPQMQVFFQDHDELLFVRVRAEGMTDKVEYVADVAVTYRKREPFTMSDLANSDFIDLLAMPNLYPYVRQCVSDLTSRVGDPLTLGIARFGRGSVERILDEDEDEDDVDATDS
jgi:hypothetical protein